MLQPHKAELANKVLCQCLSIKRSFSHNSIITFITLFSCGVLILVQVNSLLAMPVSTFHHIIQLQHAYLYLQHLLTYSSRLQHCVDLTSVVGKVIFCCQDLIHLENLLLLTYCFIEYCHIDCIT